MHRVYLRKGPEGDDWMRRTLSVLRGDDTKAGEHYQGQQNQPEIPDSLLEQKQETDGEETWDIDEAPPSSTEESPGAAEMFKHYIKAAQRHGRAVHVVAHEAAPPGVSDPLPKTDSPSGTDLFRKYAKDAQAHDRAVHVAAHEEVRQLKAALVAVQEESKAQEERRVAEAKAHEDQRVAEVTAKLHADFAAEKQLLVQEMKADMKKRMTKEHAVAAAEARRHLKAGKKKK